MRIARANLTDPPVTPSAIRNGVAAEVWRGDARHLHTVLPDTYRGRVGLVVTSPPYGPSTHGQVSAVPAVSVQKYHHRYGSTLDRGNLANIGHHRLLTGFTTILRALHPYLRPGAHVVISVRPWREHAELIDLPTQITACGAAAGLPSNAVSRCWPASPTSTPSSPAVHSFNATSSANNATPDCPYTSSRMKTS